MLNYNKIESLINRNNTPKTKLARLLEIGESTLRSRLERKNLTPDDLEKLADFFGESILYFFDKAETQNSIESKPSYTVKTPPNQHCDNPYCNKRIAELEDDKQRLKEYNDHLKALLRKGGLHEGKSNEGGLEESRTGT